MHGGKLFLVIGLLLLISVIYSKKHQHKHPKDHYHHHHLHHHHHKRNHHRRNSQKKTLHDESLHGPIISGNIKKNKIYGEPKLAVSAESYKRSSVIDESVNDEVADGPASAKHDIAQNEHQYIKHSSEFKTCTDAACDETGEVDTSEWVILKKHKNNAESSTKYVDENDVSEKTNIEKQSEPKYENKTLVDIFSNIEDSGKKQNSTLKMQNSTANDNENIVEVSKDDSTCTDAACKAPMAEEKEEKEKENKDNNNDAQTSKETAKTSELNDGEVEKYNSTLMDQVTNAISENVKNKTVEKNNTETATTELNESSNEKQWHKGTTLESLKTGNAANGTALENISKTTETVSGDNDTVKLEENIISVTHSNETSEKSDTKQAHNETESALTEANEDKGPLVEKNSSETTNTSGECTDAACSATDTEDEDVETKELKEEEEKMKALQSKSECTDAACSTDINGKKQTIDDQPSRIEEKKANAAEKPKAKITECTDEACKVPDASNRKVNEEANTMEESKGLNEAENEAKSGTSNTDDTINKQGYEADYNLKSTNKSIGETTEKSQDKSATGSSSNFPLAKSDCTDAACMAPIASSNENEETEEMSFALKERLKNIEKETVKIPLESDDQIMSESKLKEKNVSKVEVSGKNKTIIDLRGYNNKTDKDKTIKDDIDDVAEKKESDSLKSVSLLPSIVSVHKDDSDNSSVDNGTAEFLSEVLPKEHPTHEDFTANKAREASKKHDATDLSNNLIISGVSRTFHPLKKKKKYTPKKYTIQNVSD